MPLRVKGGRPRVVSAAQSAAQGRRASLAMPTIAADDSVRELARLVDAEVRARVPGASRAAKRRPKDIRHRLARRGLGFLAEALTRVILRDGGAFLRMAAAADRDWQPALASAAAKYVQLVAEYNVKTSAAAAELLRACTTDAIASALAQRVTGHPFGDGTAELVRSMLAAGTAARLDLHSALTLAAAQPEDSRVENAESERRMRQVLERRAAIARGEDPDATTTAAGAEALEVGDAK